MIGFLKGKVALKEPPLVILDVQGVGYELKVPLSGFYDLPAIGQETQLFVHVVYREDAQNAFGFLDIHDRDFFREIIKVNGVGPSLALTILSGLTVKECVQAVQNDSQAHFVALPGIGKRTAERLVMELKPRLQHWLLPQDENTGLPASNTAHASNRRFADAEAALISLGYKPAEAKKALENVNKTIENASIGFTSEDYIRTALRNLVASG